MIEVFFFEVCLEALGAEVAPVQVGFVDDDPGVVRIGVGDGLSVCVRDVCGVVGSMDDLEAVDLGLIGEQGVSIEAMAVHEFDLELGSLRGADAAGLDPELVGVGCGDQCCEECGDREGETLGSHDGSGIGVLIDKRPARRFREEPVRRITCLRC